MSDSPSKRFKVTVVGDGMVGKTCMLYVFVKKEFPQEYVPTVFDNYMIPLVVDEDKVEVTLWDTAGQEDYDRLRPLSYPKTSCFIICYSVDNRASYENVLLKWYPELKHFSGTIPIVLVATKTDLRESGRETLSKQDGRRLKKKIKAVQLVECSALRRENLDAVFTEAVRAANNHQHPKRAVCTVL